MVSGLVDVIRDGVHGGVPKPELSFINGLDEKYNQVPIARQGL